MGKFERDGIPYKRGKDIEPSGYNKNSVELLAQEVSKILQFNIRGEIESLISKLGGKIHHAPIHELNEPGSIYVHSENEFDIVTEAIATDEHTRFTIAHELGHYFLHSNQGKKPIIAYRLGIGQLEWEANWFASELLMPKKKFEKEAKKNSNTIYLANKFGVSFSAIKVRKGAIGIN